MYDLIHMLLSTTLDFPSPFSLLIFYSSTIVVKNIIATYVPMFLISYAYCFLLLYSFSFSFYGSHHVIKGRARHLTLFLQFLQTSLVDLSGQKSDLFRVNVEIHNFLAELSCCPGVVFNTPPSSLGRKDHGKHRQMMMTSDHNNPLETQDQQQQLYPHHLQHFPPRKETSITKGLKDHVVGLYSTWDEAFHK